MLTQSVPILHLFKAMLLATCTACVYSYVYILIHMLCSTQTIHIKGKMGSFCCIRGIKSASSLNNTLPKVCRYLPFTPLYASRMSYSKTIYINMDFSSVLLREGFPLDFRK